MEDNIKFDWIKDEMTISEITDNYLKHYNHCCVRPEYFTEIMDNNYFDCDLYDYAKVYYNNEEVGTIGYFRNKKYNTIWLNWFVIYEKFHGKGISSNSLRKFLYYLHKKCPETNYLRIFTENPSQGTEELYKSIGFVIENHDIWKNIFSTNDYKIFSIELDKF